MAVCRLLKNTLIELHLENKREMNVTQVNRMSEVVQKTWMDEKKRLGGEKLNNSDTEKWTKQSVLICS